MEAPVVHLPGGRELRLPGVRLVRQRFAVPPAVDVTARLEREWRRAGAGLGLREGAAVAVAVGSRGIDGLVEVVRAVIAGLRAAGCEPFVVPAMGSHGGATAEGQRAVLAALGIVPETVGAPVRATMDVVPMGEVDGIPLYLDRYAHEADGVVLINRIKPHTDFAGPMGSGLLKMLCIGLGNQEGADHCHRAGVVRDLGEIVRLAGAALLRPAHVLFGVAIVENQEHRVCDVRVLPAGEIETGGARVAGHRASTAAGPAARRHRPAHRRRDGQGHQRRGPRPQRDRTFHGPLAGEESEAAHHTHLRARPDPRIRG